MWMFLIQFIVTFSSVLCTIITFLQFFGEKDNYSDLIADWNLNQSFMVTVCVVLGIIVFITQFLLYRNKSVKKRMTGEFIHAFHNDIRDEIFFMQTLNIKKTIANHEDFYCSIKLICNDLCENIYRFIKEKTGKDFSVCIKLLQKNPKSKPRGTYTYTLCRVGRDHIQRVKNGKKLDANKLNEHEIMIPVENSTPLNNILNGEYNEQKPSIFACSNLLMLIILNKILGRPKYKSPHKDFLKYYKSTIVVPIRINKQYTIKGAPDNQPYLTLGFLCLDYKHPISKALKDELAEYAKSFADALFGLFFEIKKRDNDIKEMEKQARKVMR